MLRKKVVSLIALVAIVLGCTVTAFASTNRYDWDLSTAQEDNKTWMIGYYDTGSIAPNDDVSAATHVSIGAGMSGMAYASVTALNGVKAIRTKYSAGSGWIKTDWAVVPGQDNATEVNFYATRSLSNGKNEWIDDYLR